MTSVASRSAGAWLALDGGNWRIVATCKEADAVTAPPFEALTFSLNVLWEV